MPNETCYSYLDSPIDTLLLVARGPALVGVYMTPHKGIWGPRPEWRRDDAPLASVREQLTAYFDGTLTEFDLPLTFEGTSFQQRVWQELTRIPFGTTISYAELARRVGKPGAARAVGSANGRNPISVVVPCHRVIGASGKLTGYGGGLERKRWLLDHERAAGQGETAADVHSAGFVQRSLSIATTSGRS
jgi:methylated-DNA-[protein]-cysteine S-methyltransferase